MASADLDYFTSQIYVVREELKTHFGNLIHKLRQREVQLLNELDLIEEDYQKDKEMVGSIKEIMLNINTNTDFSNELSKQLTNCATQAKVKSVKFVCNSEWERQISSMGQLVVNSDSSPINYNEKVLPQISVAKTSRKFFRTKSTEKRSPKPPSVTSHTLAEPTSPIEERSLPKPPIVTPLATTNYYSGVAIDPITNNIYLADYSNSTVSVYNDAGVYLFKFGSKINKNAKNSIKMSGPTCIVFYNDNLFISQTDSHCILVYKMDGMLVSKFGSFGSNDGQLNNPRGLAICSTTNDIYVCDSHNNRVVVFNSDFKHKINLLSTCSVTDYQNTYTSIVHKLLVPRDVKLSINGIFVLDSSEMCVHVFNFNWKCERSLISCGGEYPEKNFINSANFLLVDKDENIILSDSASNSIKLFTSEGKLFHQIGGSNTDHLSNPGAVAIDNKNRLVIANNKQDAIIQIY